MSLCDDLLLTVIAKMALFTLIINYSLWYYFWVFQNNGNRFSSHFRIVVPCRCHLQLDLHVQGLLDFSEKPTRLFWFSKFLKHRDRFKKHLHIFETKMFL